MFSLTKLFDFVKATNCPWIVVCYGKYSTRWQSKTIRNCFGGGCGFLLQDLNSPSGIVINIVYGKAPPGGLTPNSFIYHFWQETHPFLIPSIDKWYPLRMEPPRLGHYREYHLGNILTTFVVNINCLSLSFSRSSLFITTRNILREWICLWKVHDITVV